MKKTLFFFLFPFFISLASFSQSSSIGDINKIVEALKQEIPTYEKVEKIDSETEYKLAYLKAGDVKLISVHEKGKTDKEVNWYFVNQVVIYTETNWSNSTTSEILYSEKTYHNTLGNLIAWFKNESTFVNSSSSEFIKMSRELKALSIKIREELME